MSNLRPIRRGQLIAPFGVGALVDFRGDESLMTAGLDEWPYAKDECPWDWLVKEERLQKRLNVTHFRLPPDFREPGPRHPISEPVHSLRPIPAVALLPSTRSNGAVVAVWRFIKMSLPSGP